MSHPNNTPKDDVTYWDYLGADTLLNLQHPVTTAHDEMLFIVVHQTFELWFKLAIYELHAAITLLRNNNPAAAIAPLQRVVSILNTSVKGFDPLITMSQQGYLAFRDALVPASGFQSVQFRIIEILLGIKRTPPTDEMPHSRFYWESAVQAGKTFTAFVQKYYEELTTLADQSAQNNVHDLMLRLTEQVTGEMGEEAYRFLLKNRHLYPDYAKLADTGHDLQSAIHAFRRGHHVVTRFSIGDAPGTSDAHQPNHPSCASYLLNVIQNHSTLFPELEKALIE